MRLWQQLGKWKLRGYGAITRHGFHFHESGEIAAAAAAAGLSSVRMTELHGRVTEGDRVLRGSVSRSPPTRGE